MQVTVILSPFLTATSLHSIASAELYEQMLDALDDQELVKLVSERSGQRLLDVDLDALL